MKVSRRHFLKNSVIGGATLAATGCSEDPVEALIPVLNPPDHYLPGLPSYYATTCRECSAHCGLLIKTLEGRAIKAEGNPEHPANKGKICALGQSSLQGLYSPARLKTPALRENNQSLPISWRQGIDLLVKHLKASAAKRDKKILYIGAPETGAFKTFVENWLTSAGGGVHLQIDLSPVHSLIEANTLLFNEPSLPDYRFSDVEVLLNFGTDFMESWLNPVWMSDQYNQMHAYQEGKKGKFIHISSHLSLTGSNADQWVKTPAGGEVQIALALGKHFLKSSNTLSRIEKKFLEKVLQPFSFPTVSKNLGISVSDLNNLAKTIESKSCVALSGGNTSSGHAATQLHASVNLLNYILGAVNKQIIFGSGHKAAGSNLQQIKEQLEALQADTYDIVILHNVNPVHALPQSLEVEAALRKVPFLVSLSTEEDESSKLAHLHLPTNHYLQSWGDSLNKKGEYTLQQPVMAEIPGFQTMEVGDLLLQTATLLNSSSFSFQTYYDYLKHHWKQVQYQVARKQDFKTFWKAARQRGGVFESYQPKEVKLATKNLRFPNPGKLDHNHLTMLVINSNFHHANSYGGNRPWLLESPHPVTRISWDSWVEIHPETARRLEVKDGEKVRLKNRYGEIQVKTFIHDGISPNTLAVPAGLGRSVKFSNYKDRQGKSVFLPVLESKGSIGLKTAIYGENPMKLLSPEHESMSGDYLFVVSEVTLEKLGKTVSKPRSHKSSEEVQNNKAFIQKSSFVNGSLKSQPLPPAKTEDQGFYRSSQQTIRKHATDSGKSPLKQDLKYKWEMVIDLDRCTGCSACVIACYAENNIPTVGKKRVDQGRAMNWMTINRSIETNPNNGQPETAFAPQMCAQCDNAGCEPVCPVYATYQTADGLNAMIYNRCVGTRYCSNNCIFKQRRFNWRTYQFPYPLNYQLNPNVTVREKGVMEKCTFCFQRIREKLESAKIEGRSLRTDEIQTACQQTCPTSAIQFGNIKDPNSLVSKMKNDPHRAYHQLDEFNYQPAVTYLKKVVHNRQKA